MRSEPPGEAASRPAGAPAASSLTCRIPVTAGTGHLGEALVVRSQHTAPTSQPDCARVAALAWSAVLARRAACLCLDDIIHAATAAQVGRRPRRRAAQSSTRTSRHADDAYRPGCGPCWYVCLREHDGVRGRADPQPRRGSMRKPVCHCHATSTARRTPPRRCACNCVPNDESTRHARMPRAHAGGFEPRRNTSVGADARDGDGPS